MNNYVKDRVIRYYHKENKYEFIKLNTNPPIYKKIDNYCKPTNIGNVWFIYWLTFPIYALSERTTLHKSKTLIGGACDDDLEAQPFAEFAFGGYSEPIINAINQIVPGLAFYDVDLTKAERNTYRTEVSNYLKMKCDASDDACGKIMNYMNDEIDLLDITTVLTNDDFKNKTWELSILKHHLENHKYAHNGIDATSWDVIDRVKTMLSLPETYWTYRFLHSYLHALDNLNMGRYSSYYGGFHNSNNDTITSLDNIFSTVWIKRCFKTIINKHRTDFLLKNEDNKFKYPYTIKPDAIKDKHRQYCHEHRMEGLTFFDNTAFSTIANLCNSSGRRNCIEDEDAIVKHVTDKYSTIDFTEKDAYIDI
jgi:hypothetical protein